MVKGIIYYIENLHFDKDKAVVHLTEPEMLDLIKEIFTKEVEQYGFSVKNITKDIDKFNIYLKRHE